MILPVISLVGMGGTLKASWRSGRCCLLLFPVHSLCACSVNPRNPLLPMQALGFARLFFAKTLLHLAFS